MTSKTYYTKTDLVEAIVEVTVVEMQRYRKHTDRKGSPKELNICDNLANRALA